MKKIYFLTILLFCFPSFSEKQKALTMQDWASLTKENKLTISAQQILRMKAQNSLSEKLSVSTSRDLRMLSDSLTACIDKFSKMPDGSIDMAALSHKLSDVSELCIVSQGWKK